MLHKLDHRQHGAHVHTDSAARCGHALGVFQCFWCFQNVLLSMYIIHVNYMHIYIYIYMHIYIYVCIYISTCVAIPVWQTVDSYLYVRVSICRLSCLHYIYNTQYAHYYVDGCCQHTIIVLIIRASLTAPHIRIELCFLVFSTFRPI